MWKTECQPNSSLPTPLFPTPRPAPLLLWYLWFAGTLLPLAAGDLFKDFRSLGIPRYTLSAEIAVYGVIAAMAAPGENFPHPFLLSTQNSATSTSRQAPTLTLPRSTGRGIEAVPKFRRIKRRKWRRICQSIKRSHEDALGRFRLRRSPF